MQGPLILGWRRVRDLNPGNLAVYRFSRPAPSATRTTLHINFILNLSFYLSIRFRLIPGRRKEKRKEIDNREPEAGLKVIFAPDTEKIPHQFTCFFRQDTTCHFQAVV